MDLEGNFLLRLLYPAVSVLQLACSYLPLLTSCDKISCDGISLQISAAQLFGGMPSLATLRWAGTDR